MGEVLRRGAEAEGEALRAAAEVVGISSEELRFAAGVLASVPLGAAHAALPPGRLRHVFSCVAGIAVIAWVFRSECVYLIGTTAALFLSLAVVPRRLCHVFVWVAAFAWLLYLHAVNASGEAWARGQIDFTGSQMMLTVRVITLAVNWADGSKAPSECSHSMLHFRITDAKLPGVFEFFGYCLHPCQLLAGPWIEFVTYRRWANGESPWHANMRHVPGRARATLGTLITALSVATFYILSSPYLQHDLLISERFQQMPFVKRLGWLWLYMIHYRSRFYLIWKLAEASNNASGLGFNGYSIEPGVHESVESLVKADYVQYQQQGRGSSENANGSSPSTSASLSRPNVEELHADWTRCRNVDIRRVELATSGRDLPQYWNINTGLWLRRYVYDRLIEQVPPALEQAFPRCRKLHSVVRRTKMFIALLVTQTVSGIWHGLYAGYWMFFVGSVAMLQAAKNMFRLQRALPTRRQANVLAAVHMVLTMHHLSFLACCFAMVEFRRSYQALKALNFSGVYTTGIMLLPLTNIANKLGLLSLPRKSVSLARTSSGGTYDNDSDEALSPTIAAPESNEHTSSPESKDHRKSA
jgi:lysophospholipid acyltransferase